MQCNAPNTRKTNRLTRQTEVNAYFFIVIGHCFFLDLHGSPTLTKDENGTFHLQ